MSTQKNFKWYYLVKESSSKSSSELYWCPFFIDENYYLEEGYANYYNVRNENFRYLEFSDYWIDFTKMEKHSITSN